MNLDTMRKAFGLPYFDENDLKLGERRPASDTYYYNTVFSNEKLNFKHNMMLSEIAKDDLAQGADKFMTLMWDMIIMMVVVSVIIFVAVMYLLMKLEIDRSSFSISLLKALGYAEKNRQFLLSRCIVLFNAGNHYHRTSDLQAHCRCSLSVLCFQRQRWLQRQYLTAAIRHYHCHYRNHIFCNTLYAGSIFKKDKIDGDIKKQRIKGC